MNTHLMARTTGSTSCRRSKGPLLKISKGKMEIPVGQRPNDDGSESSPYNRRTP